MHVMPNAVMLLQIFDEPVYGMNNIQTEVNITMKNPIPAPLRHRLSAYIDLLLLTQSKYS